jgi:hypothetical protein
VVELIGKMIPLENNLGEAVVNLLILGEEFVVLFIVEVSCFL